MFIDVEPTMPGENLDYNVPPLMHTKSPAASFLLAVRGFIDRRESMQRFIPFPCLPSHSNYPEPLRTSFLKCCRRACKQQVRKKEYQKSSSSSLTRIQTEICALYVGTKFHLVLEPRDLW